MEKKKFVKKDSGEQKPYEIVVFKLEGKDTWRLDNASNFNNMSKDKVLEEKHYLIDKQTGELTEKK